MWNKSCPSDIAAYSHVMVNFAKATEGKWQLRKKLFSGSIMALLLIGTLTLAFNVQPVAVLAHSGDVMQSSLAVVVPTIDEELSPGDSKRMDYLYNIDVITAAVCPVSTDRKSETMVSWTYLHSRYCFCGNLKSLAQPSLAP